MDGTLQAAETSAEVIEEAAYHLTQSDVDAALTLLAGIADIQLFTLLVQLVLVGVVLVVVFVASTRRV